MTQPVSRSVLVVDDDVEILRLVREVLASFATCAVDTTPSPEYAFELSLKKHYDLFVFDFTMPIVDGAVLYGFIRTAYHLGGLVPERMLPPLILMSGHGEDKRARALLHEPGVRGLLPKPFSLDRLLKSIEASLPGVTHGMGPTGSRS
jgi:CheY-like chemotaxis protein